MDTNLTQDQTVALLREAAWSLRELSPDSTFATAVAAWLDAEANMLAGLEPFVALINAAVKDKTGVAAYIELGRLADGSIDMRAMSTPAAVRLALVTLGRDGGDL